VKKSGAELTAVPDLWRRCELGANGRWVYEKLEGRPQKTAALAATSGVLERTTLRKLRKLEAYGLAVETADGWILGPADPREVAQKCKSAGADARQRAQHAAESKRWRERVEKWQKGS
jgi:hypothetical protein